MAIVKKIKSSGVDSIDALLENKRWNVETLTFSFPEEASDYKASYEHPVWFDGSLQLGVDETDGFEACTEMLRDAVRAGLRAVEGFTLLDIDEVEDGGGRLLFGVTDAPDPRYAGSAAYGNFPSTSYLAGDVWFDPGKYDMPELGAKYHRSAWHEIGHTLGLKHGHEEGGIEDLALVETLDGHEFTIMTYHSFIGDQDGGYENAVGSHPQSWMMLDIAALQHLYGADFGWQSGDTTYAFDPDTGEMSIDGVAQGVPEANVIFRTIWDGNGTDTYDFSAYTDGVWVNLLPGQWTDTDRAGTNQAAQLGGGPNDGFARGQIANALLHKDDQRSMIENATGGEGQDLLLGNGLANVFVGNGGGDRIEGFGGNDTQFGGAGDDSLLGDDGEDRLEGEAGVDTLVGGGQNDSLDGGADDDWMFGQDGDDTMVSGSGFDLIQGGAGWDFLDFGDATGAVELDLATGLATVAGGGGAEFETIEEFRGSLFDDLLKGDAQANVLRGGDGDDRIFAGAGASGDALYGGDGNDTLFGSAGAADGFFGGEDRDTVVLSGLGATVNLTTGIHGGTAAGDVFDGIEHLVGTSIADQLSGSTGYELLEGNAGADTLDGRAGNDTLIGGAGQDTLDGGADLDTASYAYATKGVEVNLGAGLALVGGGDADVLFNVEGAIGSAFADTLDGSAAANALTGGDGADLFFGAGGADTLSGGEGYDTLYGGEGADVIDGGGGLDTVRFAGAGVTVNLTTGINAGDALGDTYTDVEAFIGTENGDTLIGDAANQSLEGRGGNDFLDGMGGDDILIGGAGQDTLVGGDGVDRVDYLYAAAAVAVNLEAGIALVGNGDADALLGIEQVQGSAFDDTIQGDDAANFLLGFTGDDILAGGGGADTITGLQGDDTVVGGVGDTVDGFTGFDTLAFESGPVTVNLATNLHAGGASGMTITDFEVIFGTGGNDSLTAGKKALVLEGAGGDDQLFGGKGADTLRGGDGDDSLAGGLGHDELVGGAGNDTLSGSEGFDRFRFALGDGADSILGYDRDADLIVLDPASFGATNTDPMAAWLVFGDTAPNADHGWLLMDGDRLLWDADGSGPAAGGQTLITFLRGEVPADFGDFVWS